MNIPTEENVPGTCEVGNVGPVGCIVMQHATYNRPHAHYTGFQGEDLSAFQYHIPLVKVVPALKNRISTLLCQRLPQKLLNTSIYPTKLHSTRS
jgi:hypothetical protein